MDNLSIYDEAGPLEIGFDDLRKFHGSASICGLTVSYVVMQAAWRELGGGPLSRQQISVETGFPGPGARDGFEMVTRAVSREAYHIRTDVAPDDRIAEAAKGAYFFRFLTPDNSVSLGLAPSAVPDEFVPFRRHVLSGEATDSEQKAFRALQLEFSSFLQGAANREVVNVLDDAAYTPGQG